MPNWKCAWHPHFHRNMIPSPPLFPEVVIDETKLSFWMHTRNFIVLQLFTLPWPGGLVKWLWLAGWPFNQSNLTNSNNSNNSNNVWGTHVYGASVTRRWQITAVIVGCMYVHTKVHQSQRTPLCVWTTSCLLGWFLLQVVPTHVLFKACWTENSCNIGWNKKKRGLKSYSLYFCEKCVLFNRHKKV